MNGNIFGGRLLVLVILGLALCLTAMSASTPAPAPSGVGVLDMDKVYDQYVAYAKARQRWDTYQKDREDTYNTLQKGLGLSATDFAEYQQDAGGPVKINPARIAELQALAAKQLAEHDALQAKKDRTADEDDRLKVLDGYVNDVKPIISDAGDKLNTELQAEYDRISKKLKDLVDGGIQATATDKKVGIVLNKTITSGQNTETIVLWGGVDITDDVIKYLNDNFKDEMLDAPTP